MLVRRHTSMAPLRMFMCLLGEDCYTSRGSQAKLFLLLAFVQDGCVLKPRAAFSKVCCALVAVGSWSARALSQCCLQLLPCSRSRMVQPILFAVNASATFNPMLRRRLRSWSIRAYMHMHVWSSYACSFIDYLIYA